MDHIVSNITYGLIATSVTITFVLGVLLQIYGAVAVWKTGNWQSAAYACGIYLSGLVAVALCLHFTL